MDSIWVGPALIWDARIDLNKKLGPKPMRDGELYHIIVDNWKMSTRIQQKIGKYVLCWLY